MELTLDNYALDANLEAKETSDSQGPRQLPYCPVKISRTDRGFLYESYLIGDIVDVDDYIDLIDTLLMATEDDEYHIYIDSPGGYISAGSIIASAINHSRATVYTHAVGLCASAACLIHNAAAEGHATVSDFGILMIHMSMHGDQGVSSQIAIRANDQVRYVLENLLRQAKDMGYIYEDELERIQTGENIYLSAKDFKERVEAKKRGTRVVTSEPEVIAGKEDWSYDFETFNEAKDYIFPNSTKSSFKTYSHKLNEIENLLAVDDPQQSAIAIRIRAVKANTFRIRTRDNINFRIYMPSDLMMTRTYITNLCLFLSQLTEDQTVTFILGAKLIDEIATNLGAVIAAMTSCRGKIITVAAGYCSIPESFIWMYGHERYIFRYGALTFGKTDLVRYVNKYDEYFNTAFERGRELGLLTDDDLTNLRQHKTKMILRQDLPDDMY